MTIHDRIAREVPGLRLTEVPRRFLIIEYTDDSDTGSPEVTAWGLRVGESMIVVHADRTVSQFVSAPRAFGRLADTSDALVWLDDR